MKILLCDDDQKCLDYLSAELNHKYYCFEVDNARKGSELLALEHFDVVITDIHMPCGGGERILTECSVKDDIQAIVFSSTISGEEAMIYHRIGNPLIFSKRDGVHNIVTTIDSLYEFKVHINQNFPLRYG